MDLEQEKCLWQLSKRAHISAVQLKLYSKLNHFVSVLYMNKELDSNVLNTMHEDCLWIPMYLSNIMVYMENILYLSSSTVSSEWRAAATESFFFFQSFITKQQAYLGESSVLWFTQK